MTNEEFKRITFKYDGNSNPVTFGEAGMYFTRVERRKIKKLIEKGYSVSEAMMRQPPDTAPRKISGFGWNRWPGMTAGSQMSSRWPRKSRGKNFGIFDKNRCILHRFYYLCKRKEQL